MNKKIQKVKNQKIMIKMIKVVIIIIKQIQILIQQIHQIKKKINSKILYKIIKIIIIIRIEIKTKIIKLKKNQHIMQQKRNNFLHYNLIMILKLLDKKFSLLIVFLIHLLIYIII